MQTFTHMTLKEERVWDIKNRCPNDDKSLICPRDGTCRENPDLIDIENCEYNPSDDK